MRDFFKGWRRKTGIVTLVIALVFTCGWLSRSDEYEFTSGNGNGPSHFSFAFSKNVMVWMRYRAEMQWINGWQTHPVGHIGSVDPLSRIGVPVVIEWRWRGLGFDIGELNDGERPPVRVAWCVIPYWSIVIPLTLLSAYLLLVKPRPVKSMKAVESTTAEAP